MFAEKMKEKIAEMDAASRHIPRPVEELLIYLAEVLDEELGPPPSKEKESDADDKTTGSKSKK